MKIEKVMNSKGEELIYIEQPIHNISYKGLLLFILTISFLITGILCN